MTTPYFLKLDQFEGPLDLLLNLIKVNEIDIFNIDIFLLTNQYLEYLRLIKFRDLQHAGEFLEMAATLIEIKSKMLLPIEKRPRREDEEGEEDPLHSLQQRLLEYDRVRGAAEFLAKRPIIGVEIQTNNEFARLEPLYQDLEAPIKAEPISLIVLYERLIKTLPDRKKMRIQAKIHAVSVEEKIQEIIELLERVNFALFQGFYNKFASRYELVVYILAVLEMSRWKKLKIYQREILGPIWIYQWDFAESGLPLTREEKMRLLENASANNLANETAGTVNG